MKDKKQFAFRILLVILVLLPLAFPYGSREFYLIPGYGDAALMTERIVLATIVYHLVILPYWLVVGILFGSRVGSFKKAFLLGNLPIFCNALGELIYFGILGVKQRTCPVWEYLIGSHIDKFNVFAFFGHPEGTFWLFFSILLSTVCFLLVFCWGYEISQKKE